MSRIKSVIAMANTPSLKASIRTSELSFVIRLLIQRPLDFWPAADSTGTVLEALNVVEHIGIG